MQNRILALDLGLTTGWAMSVGDNVVSGVIVTTPKNKRDKSLTRVYKTFRDGLRDLFKLYTPELVVYEKIFFVARNGCFAVQRFGGLESILLLEADAFDIPCEGISVSTVRHALFSRGKVTKQDVVELIKKIGFSIHTDHEADAIALLLCKRGLTIEQYKTT